MKYLLSEHVEERMQERGITLTEINDTVNKGKEYKSKLHGGQLRFYYQGVCVIVRKSSNLILTAYKLNHH